MLFRTLTCCNNAHDKNQKQYNCRSHCVWPVSFAGLVDYDFYIEHLVTFICFTHEFHGINEYILGLMRSGQLVGLILKEAGGLGEWIES